MPPKSQVQPSKPAFFFTYVFFSLSVISILTPIWWCSTCQLIEVQVFFCMKRATCSSHLGLACCCNVASSRHLFLAALKGQIQRQYRFHFLTRAGYGEEVWLPPSTVSSWFHNLQDHVARGPLQILPKIFAGIDRCLPNCYETWGDDHPSGLSGKAEASGSMRKNNRFYCKPKDTYNDTCSPWLIMI